MAINGKINLLKYNDARKVIIGGVRGIFIPVDSNPTIFAGEKGAYAGIRVVEHESEYENIKYTHFFAASLDRKTKEKIEAEEGKEAVKKYTPILGNATDYNATSDSYSEEVEDLPAGNNTPNYSGGYSGLPF